MFGKHILREGEKQAVQLGNFNEGSDSKGLCMAILRLCHFVLRTKGTDKDPTEGKIPGCLFTLCLS